VNVFLDDRRTGWINSGLVPLAPVSIGVKLNLRTWNLALCVVRAVVSKRGVDDGNHIDGGFPQPAQESLPNYSIN